MSILVSQYRSGYKTEAVEMLACATIRLQVLASPVRNQPESYRMPRTQQNLTKLRDAFSQILGNQKDHYTDARIPELLFGLVLDDCVEYSSKKRHLERYRRVTCYQHERQIFVVMICRLSRLMTNWRYVDLRLH